MNNNSNNGIHINPYGEEDIVYLSSEIEDVSLLQFVHDVSEYRIDPLNKFFCVEDGILFSRDKTTLVSFPKKREGSYTIPPFVEVIDRMAFSASKLTEIIVPGNIEEIRGMAFYNCRNLEKLVLSEGISVIGNQVLDYCMSLKSFDIPSSVKVLGRFGVMKSVEAINVAPGNSVYKSVDGILYQIYGRELVKCPAGYKGDVKVAEGTQVIRTNAFECCMFIENVSIPDNISVIGSSSFSKSSVKRVNIPGSVKIVSPLCFSYCSELKHVEVSEGVLRIGDSAFTKCDSLKAIKLPPSVTEFVEYSNEKRDEFAVICEAPVFRGLKAYKKFCTALYFLKHLEEFEDYNRIYMSMFINKYSGEILEYAIQRSDFEAIRCFAGKYSIEKETLSELISNAQKRNESEIVAVLLSAFRGKC